MATTKKTSGRSSKKVAGSAAGRTKAAAKGPKAKIIKDLTPARSSKIRAGAMPVYTVGCHQP